MTELVTSGSVGGMASNGCLYPEVATHLWGLRPLNFLLWRAPCNDGISQSVPPGNASGQTFASRLLDGMF